MLVRFLVDDDDGVIFGWRGDPRERRPFGRRLPLAVCEPSARADRRPAREVLSLPSDSRSTRTKGQLAQCGAVVIRHASCVGGKVAMAATAPTIVTAGFSFLFECSPSSKSVVFHIVVISFP